jgi:hypothetical protein
MQGDLGPCIIKPDFCVRPVESGRRSARLGGCVVRPPSATYSLRWVLVVGVEPTLVRLAEREPASASLPSRSRNNDRGCRERTDLDGR